LIKVNSCWKKEIPVEL